MNQPPPDDSREVLTWIRDREGSKRWTIDRFNGQWYDWKSKVLYWKELDPEPEYEEEYP